MLHWPLHILAACPHCISSDRLNAAFTSAHACRTLSLDNAAESHCIAHCCLISCAHLKADNYLKTLGRCFIYAPHHCVTAACSLYLNVTLTLPLANGIISSSACAFITAHPCCTSPLRVTDESYCIAHRCIIPYASTCVIIATLLHTTAPHDCVPLLHLQLSVIHSSELRP